MLASTMHFGEINQPPTSPGWVKTPRNTTELRKIPYPAGLLNMALEPLYAMEKPGETFNKILFLKDVM